MKGTEWLSKVPEFLYRTLWVKIGQKQDELLEKRFRLLYTGTSQEMRERVRIYRCRQIGMILIFGLCAVIMILAAYAGEKVAASSIVIERNTYGEGQKEESLVLENGETIQFTVEERIYTREEMNRMFEENYTWVMEHMLKDNQSMEEVRTDLEFMTELPGGFTAEWVSESPEVLDSEGKVYNQEWDTGTEYTVRVQLFLSYMEEEQAHSLLFCVKEPLYTEEESLILQIKKWIRNVEEETREQESFRLPGVISGVQIAQPETNEMQGIYLMIIALFFFLFFYSSNRMKEQGELRKQQLEEDYPILIHKLVLYLGAGINLKNTFVQIAEEYAQDVEKGQMQKRYMYEELLVMVNEMRAGQGEQRSYELFSDRIGNNAYTRLISLLVQNLQKGNDGLLKALRAEESDAFFLRIDQAKKAAEEAGTKLLFPMLLMLVLIMAIVMAPALLQFGNF